MTSRRAWILYDWANSAHTLVIATAMMPVFFKDVAAKELPPHISTALWGYLDATVYTVVAILAPILGTLGDGEGRKKKLFTLFFFPAILATALLVCVRDGAWFTCLFLYGLSLLGFACTNVFYDAFLIDVAPVSEMDKVSSQGQAAGYIGGTLAFVVCFALLQYHQLLGIEHTADAVRLSFLFIAFWWLVFTLPFLRHVKHVHFRSQQIRLGASFKHIYKTVADAGLGTTPFRFLIAYFFFIDGVYTVISMAGVYGKDLGLTNNSLLGILLLSQVVAFPSTLLVGYFARLAGARSVLRTCVLIYIPVVIYAFFVTTQTGFLILAVLVGLVQGGTQALSRAEYAKLVPPQQSSEYFGFFNIVGRCAAIIGPLLVAVASQITGSSRFGVLSLIVLFVTGTLLLGRVPAGNAAPAAASDSETDDT